MLNRRSRSLFVGIWFAFSRQELLHSGCMSKTHWGSENLICLGLGTYMSFLNEAKIAVVTSHGFLVYFTDPFSVFSESLEVTKEPWAPKEQNWANFCSVPIRTRLQSMWWHSKECWDKRSRRQSVNGSIKKRKLWFHYLMCPFKKKYRKYWIWNQNRQIE